MINNRTRVLEHAPCYTKRPYKQGALFYFVKTLGDYKVTLKLPRALTFNRLFVYSNVRLVYTNRRVTESRSSNSLYRALLTR